MATEFNFTLDDKPGALAMIAEALGEAGINIDAGAGVRFGGQGVITLVTDKVEEASRVLNQAQIQFETTEVLLVKLKDRPGALAELTRNFAEKGVNLTSFYLTMVGQQVLGADDVAAARAIAEEMGVLDE